MKSVTSYTNAPTTIHADPGELCCCTCAIVNTGRPRLRPPPPSVPYGLPDLSAFEPPAVEQPQQQQQPPLAPPLGLPAIDFGGGGGSGAPAMMATTMMPAAAANDNHDGGGVIDLCDDE